MPWDFYPKVVLDFLNAGGYPTVNFCDFLLVSSDFDSQMSVISSSDGLNLSSALRVLSLHATRITLVKITLLGYIQYGTIL